MTPTTIDNNDNTNDDSNNNDRERIAEVLRIHITEYQV